MSYEFEIFGSDHYEAYRALFERQDRRPDDEKLARRRWWCFENPHGGAFAVAKYEGQVVSTCYLGGKRLNVNGREVAAFEIGETATEPEHQRRGLFSKLVNACTHYAYENGAELVYGTPNRQSTPGYDKLGFHIQSDPASWLFLMPNAAYWTRFPVSVRDFLGRDTVSELSASGYIAETAGFPRANAASRDYVSWRLAASPADYKFFRTRIRDKNFFCAVKYGSLSRYPVLVCSEYFLEGQKPETEEAASLIRRVCAGAFDRRTYAAVYFHARNFDAARRLGLFVRGIAPHRQLPVCLKSKSDGAAPVDFGKFQLSDCDIG